VQINEEVGYLVRAEWSRVATGIERIFFVPGHSPGCITKIVKSLSAVLLTDGSMRLCRSETEKKKRKEGERGRKRGEGR